MGLVRAPLEDAFEAAKNYKRIDVNLFNFTGCLCADCDPLERPLNPQWVRTQVSNYSAAAFH